MSEREIAPCPFCGSDKVADDGTFVVCDDCGALGPDTERGTEDHIAAWNNPAAVQAEREARPTGLDIAASTRATVEQAVQAEREKAYEDGYLKGFEAGRLSGGGDDS